MCVYNLTRVAELVLDRTYSECTHSWHQNELLVFMVINEFHKFRYTEEERSRG